MDKRLLIKTYENMRDEMFMRDESGEYLMNTKIWCAGALSLLARSGCLTVSEYLTLHDDLMNYGKD